MLEGPAAVIGLSLLAAFMLAVVGLLTRLGLVHGSLHESVVLTFVGSWLALAPLVVLSAWPPVATSRGLLLFALDGLCGFGAVALLYVGIGSVGPSISYAMKSTAPLTAVALATLVLGEVEPWPVYVGALLAVVGVAVLSLERLAGEIVLNRRALYPLVGACLFGLANTLRRGALAEVSSPVVGATIAISASLLASLVWHWQRRQRLAKSRGSWFFLGAGVLQGLALFAVYTALRTGHVAVVVPLYTSTPLFVLAFSPLVLGRLERLTPRVVAGALIVLAGVMLISVNQP